MDAGSPSKLKMSFKHGEEPGKSGQQQVRAMDKLRATGATSAVLPEEPYKQKAGAADKLERAKLPSEATNPVNKAEAKHAAQQPVAGSGGHGKQSMRKRISGMFEK